MGQGNRQEPNVKGQESKVRARLKGQTEGSECRVRGRGQEPRVMAIPRDGLQGKGQGPGAKSQRSEVKGQGQTQGPD